MRVFTKSFKLIIALFLIAKAGWAQESLDLYDIKTSRFNTPPDIQSSRLDVLDFNGDGQDDISFFFIEQGPLASEKSAVTNFIALELKESAMVNHDSLRVGVENGVPILRNVFAADFTGDGEQEIVAAYYKEALDNFSSHMNEIRMYKYDADYNKYASKNIFNENRTASVPSIQQMAIGDFNADSHMDLILDYNNTNKTTLFINDGIGNFTQKALNGGYFLEQVSIADLNGDGFDDVIAKAKSTASATAKFMVKYMTNGPEQAFEDLHFSTDEYWVVPGDFDNDGDVDLAGKNAYLNDGNGNFTLSLESAYAGLFRTGDVDGNGDEELYVSAIDENQVYIVILDYIDQAWQEIHKVRAENMFSLVTGDFDGDGEDEFAGYNQDEFQVPQFVLYNDITVFKPEVNVTGYNSTSINITWAPQDGVPQYLLDVATDADFSNLLSGYEQLPYENTGVPIAASIGGLTKGETYHYRVRPYLREQYGPAFTATFVAGQNPTQQPLSLDDLQYDKNLVFPNPVHKGQQLTINRSNPDLQYHLTTMQGNRVMQGNGHLLNIQNLNSGMYLLKVIDGNKKSVSKIIVQ